MTTYDYLKCNFTIDTYTISASLAAIRQGMPWPFGWQRLAESDPLCFESCTVPVQLLRQFECFARDWMKHDLLKGCSAIGKYEIDVDGPILTLLISRSVYCVETVHSYPDSIQVKLAPFKNTHTKKTCTNLWVFSCHTALCLWCFWSVRDILRNSLGLTNLELFAAFAEYSMSTWAQSQQKHAKTGTWLLVTQRNLSFYIILSYPQNIFPYELQP